MDPTVEDIYALTPLQQGMLFHTVCATTPGLYVVQSCWTLRGSLDVPRFVAAWQNTIGRHPALRTGFEWRDLENPVQVVYRDVELPPELIDWRGMTEAEQEAHLAQFLEKDRARGFDLSSPPLHRLALCRTEEDRSTLVWSYHQAVLDGWSAALIHSEVAETYSAWVKAEEPALPQPVPYRSYLAWLEQQDRGRVERFWRQRLAGFVSPTGIQPRRDEVSPSTLAAGRHEAVFAFDECFTGALTAVLRSERLTSSTLIQAAWALVLGRRSRSRDVVFGAVVSGRPPQLPDIESMVGFFINTVPVRVEIPKDMPLGAWLRKLQESFFEVKELEHSALLDIQRWCDVPRGRALFESIVAFENYPDDDPKRGWGGDTETLGFVAHENLNYPIALFAGVVAGRLTLKLLYDGEHYERTTVQWALDELKSVVEQVVGGLDESVVSLNLVSPSERHRLIVDWNATDADFPLDEVFCHLFELQVERTPEQRAVVCGDDALTYVELNQRANGAARVLARAGIGPGQIVGILADRGIDFLIAILATFKAGGAYLPLDPRAPSARLARTWEMADLSLVLHSAPYTSVCAETVGAMVTAAPTLRLLSDVVGAAAFEDNPAVAAGPSDLAYVIFTSGSTGTPKGAMVEQRGMVNHLFAKIDDLGIHGGDRIAQNASQCFDISVWQFLAALLVGGETHILPDEVALSPKALLDAVERQGVTILETVPSLFGLLLGTEAPTGVPGLGSLRWVVPTGEALPPELASWWLDGFPHVSMLNAYGPTECSDDVAHYPVTTKPRRNETRIPIGRPIANTSIYILDERMCLLPIGVPGELYVGGIGVGRGYINDPQRTAQSFVPDPFAEEAGARLYRTGDLARYLPDGAIDFLGRLDHQVKIRGFRIELGDIEAALNDHLEVERCVVTARTDDHGESQLVAYFTCKGTIPAVQALRDHLAGRLPDYMVPQVFVPLEVLPLTANGKLDRKALPSPDGRRLDPSEAFVPPKEGEEERVALAWRQVLGVDRVGRRDNFFDLGGHSLLMLKVYELLRRHHPDLALVDLFHYPTVDSLSRFLSSGDESPHSRTNGERGRNRREALRRQRERRTRAGASRS